MQVGEFQLQASKQKAKLSGSIIARPVGEIGAEKGCHDRSFCHHQQSDCAVFGRWNTSSPDGKTKCFWRNFGVGFLSLWSVGFRNCSSVRISVLVLKMERKLLWSTNAVRFRLPILGTYTGVSKIRLRSVVVVEHYQPGHQNNAVDLPILESFRCTRELDLYFGYSSRWNNHPSPSKKLSSDDRFHFIIAIRWMILKVVAFRSLYARLLARGTKICCCRLPAKSLTANICRRRISICCGIEPIGASEISLAVYLDRKDLYHLPAFLFELPCRTLGIRTPAYIWRYIFLKTSVIRKRPKLLTKKHLRVAVNLYMHEQNPGRVWWRPTWNFYGTLAPIHDAVGRGWPPQPLKGKHGSCCPSRWTEMKRIIIRVWVRICIFLPVPFGP